MIYEIDGVKYTITEKDGHVYGTELVIEEKERLIKILHVEFTKSNRYPLKLKGRFEIAICNNKRKRHKTEYIDINGDWFRLYCELARTLEKGIPDEVLESFRKHCAETGTRKIMVSFGGGCTFYKHI